MQIHDINVLLFAMQGPLPAISGDDTILTTLWLIRAKRNSWRTRDRASGDPSDIYFTGKLASAGDIVGIKVLDHIIVAENGYTRMLEKGYLKTG